jgi:hypothetical protein
VTLSPNPKSLSPSMPLSWHPPLVWIPLLPLESVQPLT